jgi:hypothetical protein
MKVFVMAIVCCSLASMMDLQAKKMIDLTPVQESRVISLFPGNKFIAGRSVYSPAGDTIKDIVKSFYQIYPRETDIEVAIGVYHSISEILPKKYLKGDLMAFIKEVVADYQEELAAMGR